jgi:hypothetical protein
MKEGHGPVGRDYIVDGKRTWVDQGGTITFELFHLADPQEDLTLGVKMVGNQLELRVYFAPEDFEPGDRQDLLDNGLRLFFQQPATEDFRPADLEFSTTIPHAQEGKDFIYEMKAQGPLYGEVHVEQPEGSLRVGQDLFVGLVEYFCGDDWCENPHMVMLETGGADSPRGGSIEMLLGTTINLSEATVLQKAEEVPLPVKRSWNPFRKS